MKSIELITAGELKFPGLKKLEEKYLQNINYYVKCNLKIIKEFKHKDEKVVIEKEGQRMSEHLKPTDMVIALDRKGKKMDSLKFADFLSRHISYHAGRIVFLIGGYAGLSKTLDARIRVRISFSDLTFPHDLFRILFLEQVYRALTIIFGVTYHR